MFHKSFEHTLLDGSIIKPVKFLTAPQMWSFGENSILKHYAQEGVRKCFDYVATVVDIRSLKFRFRC